MKEGATLTPRANSNTVTPINKPTAIKINENYATDRCVLTELSLSRATFEMELYGQIPRLLHFYGVLLKFVLPGTQLGIACPVDIERVYITRQNSKRPAYGLVVKFASLSNEDKQKLRNYLTGQSS